MEQNIGSTFSPKSDLVRAEIMKKNNMEGSSTGFLLEKITMFFSRAEISEKEAITSIQKELGISQKVAGQIMVEIKNTLIPTLWNNLSQKDRESLSHIKNEVATEGAEETEETLPKKIPTSSDIKNNLDVEPPKKSVPPSSVPAVNRKSDGPDKYREPIE